MLGVCKDTWITEILVPNVWTRSACKTQKVMCIDVKIVSQEIMNKLFSGLFTGPERFPSSSADTYQMAVLRTGHWMNSWSPTNAGWVLNQMAVLRTGHWMNSWSLTNAGWVLLIAKIELLVEKKKGGGGLRYLRTSSGYMTCSKTRFHGSQVFTVRLDTLTALDFFSAGRLGVGGGRG